MRLIAVVEEEERERIVVNKRARQTNDTHSLFRGSMHCSSGSLQLPALTNINNDSACPREQLMNCFVNLRTQSSVSLVTCVMGLVSFYTPLIKSFIITDIS